MKRYREQTDAELKEMFPDVDDNKYAKTEWEILLMLWGNVTIGGVTYYDIESIEAVHYTSNLKDDSK